MLLFEITAIIALFAVLIAVTYTMVCMMSFLTKRGLHFIPAAWLTTLWGVVAIIAKSVFLLDILRTVFNVG